MIDGENKKICMECKEDVYISLFGLNNATKDKLATRCKPCCKIKDEKYRRSKGVKAFVCRLAKKGMKECSLCHLVKDVTFFNKNKNTKDGLQTHCRICSNIKSREYDTCPLRRRKRKLWSNFRMTNEEYEQRLKNQDYSCAICNSKETKNSYTQHFAVDHCHAHEKETGEIKVRGLLCDQCNMGLGAYEDDIERMKKAIKYLEEN